jgi:hypothetical protein
MRKILLVIASCFSLVGCTVTLAEIQAATVQACGFLPTAVTVASFFPAVGPYIGTAGAIAQTICTAVATQVPPAAIRRGHRLGASATTRVTIQLPDGATATVTGYFVR